MWPAIVVDESVVVKRKGLNNKAPGGNSILVQFFGTHDFARLENLHKPLELLFVITTELLKRMFQYNYREEIDILSLGCLEYKPSKRYHFFKGFSQGLP